MIEMMDTKETDKPLMRCVECDREMEHYNVQLSPTNEQKIVCWECWQRADKGFFTKRGFRREARGGDIPR